MKKKMKKKRAAKESYWLLRICGDVEPQSWDGPYSDYSACLAAAAQIRLEEGDSDGLFFCKTEKSKTPPIIDSFSNREIDMVIEEMADAGY